MDPALIQMLRAGQPQDEVAVLVRLAGAGVPGGVRVVSRFGDIATVRVARRDIPRLHAEDDVKSVKAPRLYSPDWIPSAPQDTIAADRRSSDERRPPGLTYTGQGVITALIDWGLDVAHPDFRNLDGSSRVLALWDQRVRSDGRSNNRYRYGWVHERGAINHSLRQDDPYHELGYRPFDTSRGPTHGTHTAGIMAGNGRSGGPIGMAPEADLVFVHLADPLSAVDANLGSSVALQEGIDFIARVAGRRPWVLNLSLGRHAGPHDGSTLVELGIDAALAAPGRACIQSTGNYLSRPIHTQGELRPGEVRDIAFHTGEENSYTHELDLWYSGRDRITVELISPSGDSVGWCATGEESRLLSHGQLVGSIFNRRHDPNNRDNQALISVQPNAPRGSWRMRLRAVDVLDGRFHCWIERDSSCSACQPGFETGDIEPASTTGTICNGFLTVAVGAYDAHRPERTIAPFSSKGPTRDGRFKPDLLAPGVDVLSCRSAASVDRAGLPGLARMSGTSMGAPAVAGTVAVMFEAAGRPLPVRQTRELLLRSAQAPGSPEPQTRWGSGYLDVEAAVAAAEELRRGGARDTWRPDSIAGLSPPPELAGAILTA